MRRAVAASMGALLLVACEAKAPRREADEPVCYRAEEFTEVTEMTGSVLSASDGEVALLTEAGDTCTFLLHQAEANHRVLGGYGLNDRVAIVPGKGDNAEALVNLTTLTGRWVRRNEADEASGFHLQEGGVALPIRNDARRFRSWAMHGATLLLTWIDDDSDAAAERMDSFAIRRLSGDTLMLVALEGEPLESTYYRLK